MYTYTMMYALGSLALQEQPELNRRELIKKLYYYNYHLAEHSVSFWRQDMVNRLGISHGAREYIYTNVRNSEQPYKNGYNTLTSSTWPYKGEVKKIDHNAKSVDICEMKDFMGKTSLQRKKVGEILLSDKEMLDFLMDGPNDNNILCYTHTKASHVIGFMAESISANPVRVVCPLTHAASIALSAGNFMAILGSDRDDVQKIVIAARVDNNNLSLVKIIKISCPTTGSFKKISWMTPDVVCILSTTGSLYNLDIATEKLYEQRIFKKSDPRRLADFAINKTNPREYLFRDNNNNLYYGHLGACGITKPFFFGLRNDKLKNLELKSDEPNYDTLDACIFHENTIYLQESGPNNSNRRERCMRVFDIR